MIGTFFGKVCSADTIFNGSKIAANTEYKAHINQYNTIFIDFSEMPKECDSYKKYISRIEEGIYYDLREKYSDLYLKQEDAIWDIYSKIFEQH